jgi:predicted nucleic acid-binding protein
MAMERTIGAFDEGAPRFALPRPPRVEPFASGEFVAELREVAILGPTTGTLRVVRADPSDDKLLECAVAGRADYIVSGDEHLLELREHGGVRVLRVP